MSGLYQTAVGMQFTLCCCNLNDNMTAFQCMDIDNLAAFAIVGIPFHMYMYILAFKCMDIDNLAAFAIVGIPFHMYMYILAF